MSAEVSLTNKSETGHIAALQSQLRSLQNRVKELEAENSKLSSRLSRCSCFEREKELNGFNNIGSSCSVEGSRESNTCTDKTNKKKAWGKVPGHDKTLRNHLRRHIALKIMYFGQRFYGFASEAQTEPTVESEIFRALEKARLLVGDRKESHYSRCGRTDKGVSSVGQVISLFLRSNLKATNVTVENQVPEDQYEGEIDYVRVLNRVLPSDIRVLGWCPVPVGFSARFSCLSREYKYFFWKENLNVKV